MLTIRSIDPIPASPLDTDFQSLYSLISRYNRELIGGPQWDTDPETDLAQLHADKDHRRFRWFAEFDGEPVGYANMRVNVRDAADAGNVLIYVLPEHRRKGVGAKLLEALEDEVARLGLKRLEAWVMTPVPVGPTITATHGVGEAPADHDGIRMAIAAGFQLGQVERVSRYDFARPLVDPHEALAEAQAKAGDDYEVVTWEGITPDDMAADLAHLKERMSLDVPAGGLTTTERAWDIERLLEADRQFSIANRLHRAVVRHRPTGAIVGLNELVRDKSNGEAFVDQWDTIVLPEHRGRRLGMLVKAANLIRVRELEPSATEIITWNAEENRHMLNVNEALGFEEIMREAAFEKHL